MDGLRNKIQVRQTFDDRRTLDREEPGERKQTAFRLLLCSGFFVVAFALVGARGALLTGAGDGDPAVVTVADSEAHRPTIQDRNGMPLAMNRRGTSLVVAGNEVWEGDVGEVVSGLTGLFPSIDAARLEERLTARKRTPVLNGITEEEQQAVFTLSLPGVRFPERVARAYPQKNLAAHLVGYTEDGRGGVAGAERYLDRARRPEGAPLTLSMHVIVQQALEEELAATVTRFGAKGAVGVLMDVTNGEILASASLPDFNPNRPSGDAEGMWVNKVTSGRFELGSAFKPITVAAALDQGAIRLMDEFNVNPPLEVGGWSISDYSFHKPVLTTTEIIQYSSNIGTVRIAQAMGDDAFVEALRSFGFLDPIETDLGRTVRPVYRQQWRAADLAVASYGHGIAITPLHLVTAFGATVNGGVYVTPRFLRDEGTVEDPRRLFSERTSAQMRLVLRKTVTEGTGRRADVPGFYPIGKTATAEKPVNGAYQEDGPLVSSFVGAFPGYDPKYALLITIDEPQRIAETGGYATAGHVAAPTFKRVVERVAPVLGLRPVGDDVAFDGFVGLRRDGTALLTDERSSLVGATAETLQ